MLKPIRDFLINDEELDIGWQRFLSLVFLFIAGMMCFFTYTRKILIWGWDVWELPANFQPDLPSAIIGIILLAPLYLRNILKWNRSVYTIISFILILLVFASLVKLSLGAEHSSIIISLIIASIVLSWLGIRGIAGISWLLVVASAVFSFFINSYVLGFSGFVFVACGFLGLLMHTGLNPGSLMKSLKDEYSKPIIDTANIAKSEIETTGVIAKTL